MKKEIIAIDGPSASGKSTIAKAVAKRLNYKYIDSGAMYRCVAYYVIKNNIKIETINSILSDINIEFDTDNNVYLNGIIVNEELRSNDVTNLVSSIASIKEVRDKLVSIQQGYGKDKGIVMDGRDIGSVVFKDAKVKIYQVASVEARAFRRHKENLLNNRDSNLEDIKASIIKRDYDDMNRSISPLIRAEDAIDLDTSNLSVEENVELALKLIKERVME